MTTPEHALMERPCIYGLDMNANGWVTDTGDVFFPAGLPGRYRDLVMTWQQHLIMLDLKGIDLRTGIGRAVLPPGEVWRGPVIPLSTAAKASSYVDAFSSTSRLLVRLPSAKSGQAYWGLDEKGHLHSLCWSHQGKWVRTRFSAGMSNEEESYGREHAEQLPAYEPEGLAYTVERIIDGMGQYAPKCRRGRLAWTMRHGTAVMDLALRENTGILATEVHLVRIGRRTRKLELMRYLLSENRMLPGFGFSVYKQEVVIALILPVKFIRESTTPRLLKDLLERSDAYDNHLVKEFQAEWC